MPIRRENDQSIFLWEGNNVPNSNPVAVRCGNTETSQTMSVKRIMSAVPYAVAEGRLTATLEKVTASDWWSKVSPEQKRVYLKKHPKSAFVAAPEWKSPRLKTPRRAV